MKIRIFLIIYIVTFSLLYSQNKSYKESLKLKSSIQYSEEWQVKCAVQQLISSYSYAFKYFNELKTGLYKFEKSKNKNSENLFLSIYDKEGKNIIDRIQLTQIKIDNVISLIINKDEEKRLVDFTKLALKNRYNANNSLSNIIESNNILWDQEILQSHQLDQYKILNKKIVYGHVQNQNNEWNEVYKLLEDISIIPYANGTDPKIVSVDSRWDNVTFMNGMTLNAHAYVSQAFGEFGHGTGQFSHPSSITFGRDVISGRNDIYPLYVCDQYNNRIIKVNYNIITGQEIDSYIDASSFSIFNSELHYPYDISFFKNQTDPIYDKLWCSEADYKSPGLACLTKNGQILHKIKGLRYENNPGQFYILYFEPHMRPRISVYSDAVGMLAFTYANETKNSIAAFVLDENGEPYSMYNDTVVNASYEEINFNYKISSILIQKPSTRSIVYPYLWVTSGGFSPPFLQTENMIHDFAINKGGYFAYLGSTRQPRNSDLPFVNLLNISSNNDYRDILTVEEWSWYYGVRKYWPFADINSDYVTNYCSEAKDEMQWRTLFTNECNIRLRVDRKPQNSGSWEPVKIRSVDGQIPDPSTPYFIDIARSKGGTALTGEDPVDIHLKLPLEDYVVPGTQLRLRVKIFPEYIIPDDNNANYVSPPDYIVGIDNQCLPVAGGCPYIYVNNTDGDFIADNNILPKSEIARDGADIMDRYKLNVEPQIMDNKINIALVENESDHSYFDQIKLYAVDYDETYKFNITENNDFVLYNPQNVISTDNASLNNITDITHLIQYRNPSNVTGQINNVVYAHYPSTPSDKNKNSKTDSKVNSKVNSRADSKQTVSIKNNNTSSTIVDSIAIISLLSNINPPVAVTQKNWAGELTATMNSGAFKITNFSRRENLSESIIPVFPIENSTFDYLDHININWLSDFKVKYIAIVPLLYNQSKTITELPLDAATHSTIGDIKRFLLYKDNKYAELQSQELINIVYNTTTLPILPSGMKRDFVIEINGNYITSLDKGRLLKINNIPIKTELLQNYPNPFNPTTNIKYSILKDGKVKIVIYNLLGQEVKTLEDDFKKAGVYEIVFDGKNYPSGVYFYQLQTNEFSDTKKMLIVK